MCCEFRSTHVLLASLSLTSRSFCSLSLGGSSGCSRRSRLSISRSRSCSCTCSSSRRISRRHLSRSRSRNRLSRSRSRTDLEGFQGQMEAGPLGSVVRVVESIEETTLQWTESSLERGPQDVEHTRQSGLLEILHDVPIFALLQPSRETIRDQALR